MGYTDEQWSVIVAIGILVGVVVGWVARWGAEIDNGR